MADQWASKMGFVLASIGAAVGLGNIWRFPYIAAQHGGIWFLIPYLICVLLIGIPLFLLEAGQGFLSKKSFFLSTQKSPNLSFIHPKLRAAIGAFPILVSTIILGYYMALCSWASWFAFEFIAGHAPTFTIMQQGFGTVIAFIFIFCASYLVVMRGIRKGIEPVNRLMVPLLFIFLLLLTLYCLTLPGAFDRLTTSSGEMQKLLEAKTWYYALAQVLFSLSVGYGIMFTYAIHLRGGRDIFKSSFMIASADTAASLLALLAIMAISTAAGGANSGLALSFEALPAFFLANGLFGFLIGSVFFILLFSVAFTSVLSMLEHVQVSSSFLQPQWKFAIGTLILLVGLFSILSYSPFKLELFGKPILDILDFVFGTFLAPFAALAVVVSCAYLMPHHGIARAIGVPARWRSLFVLMTRKVIPIALVILIIFAQVSGLY